MAKAIDVQRAVRKILKINFNPIFLGLTITPVDVTWEYALQFKNDDKKNWHPKVVRLHRQEDTVSIRNGYLDTNATYVGAATILTMAENNVTVPPETTKDK